MEINEIKEPLNTDIEGQEKNEIEIPRATNGTIEQDVNNVGNQEDNPITESSAPTVEELQAKILELEEYKNNSIESNQKIIEVFKQNPEIVNIMKMMTQGASFMEAVARNIDIASIAPQEGDPDFEKWKQSNEERVNATKKAQEAIGRIQGNVNISREAYKSFIENKKLSEEETDKLSEKLETAINDINDGLVGEDIIDMIYKSMNFDSIVEAAKQEGAVDARNMKIEQMKENVKKDAGDGLPNIKSVGENTPKETQTKKTDLEQMIELSNRKF